MLTGDGSDEDTATESSDGGAFTELFERHFDDVYRYLAFRVGAVVAEDLAAETFARAFAGRQSFEPDRGSVRAWLFGIARNLIRDHRRDERREMETWRRANADRLLYASDDAARLAERLRLRSAFGSLKTRSAGAASRFEASPRRWTGQWPRRLTVVFVAAAIIVVFFVPLPGKSLFNRIVSPTKSPTTTTMSPPVTRATQQEIKTFVALAERGLHREFTATYLTVVTDGAGATSLMTVKAAQVSWPLSSFAEDSPRLMYEQSVSGSLSEVFLGALRSSRSAPGWYTCTTPAHKLAWTCSPVDQGMEGSMLIGAYLPGNALSGLQALAGGSTVPAMQHDARFSEKVVAGRKLKCLDFGPARNPRAVVCETNQGIIAYYSSQVRAATVGPLGTTRLVSLSFHASNTEFVLPGKVPPTPAHRVGLSQFKDSSLRVDYPSGWNAVVLREDTMFSLPLVYLSHEANPRCSAPYGITRPDPLPQCGLGSDGVLVEWSENGFPGWTFSRQPGKRVTVDGQPGKERVVSGGENCVTGTQQSVTLVVARTAPDNWYEMDACLRGPDLAREHSEIQAMIASAKILQP
ncbi:MAG: RNA polymerase sigma factor [Acidimicrobiales bacterium]